MKYKLKETKVISEGSIPAANSARASRVKARFVTFSRRVRIWNVRLHARENHLCYALCTLRGTPPTKTIIIPWEIRKVQPQVRPVSGTEMPKTSPRQRLGSSCGRFEETEQETEIGDRMNPEKERV